MPSKKAEATVKQTLVILAVNDLESTKIYKLLNEAKIPVLAYNYAWGEKIIYESKEIAGKYPPGTISKILFIERKKKEDISILKELYPDAGISYLDHHSYSGELASGKHDEGNDKDEALFQRSALEQIIDYLPELSGHRKDKDFNKIVANDKDFIPGLAEVLLNENKIFEKDESFLRELWQKLDECLRLEMKPGKLLANEKLTRCLPKCGEHIKQFITDFENLNYGGIIEDIKTFREQETLIQYAFKNKKGSKPYLAKGTPFAVRVVGDEEECSGFNSLTDKVKNYVDNAEAQWNMRRFTTGRIRDDSAPALTLIRYPSQFSFAMSDQLYFYEKEQKKEQFLTFCLSDFYQIDNEGVCREETSDPHQETAYWKRKSLRQLCDHINQRVRNFYINYSPYIGIIHDGEAENHTDSPIYEDHHTGFIYSGETGNDDKKRNLREKADGICNQEHGMYSYGGRNYYGVGFDDKKTSINKIQLPLNKILDHHLHQLLIENRPLKAWRTSFFQSLAYEGEKKRAGLKEISQHFDVYDADDQEKAFFLSYLRKLITPGLNKNYQGFSGQGDIMGRTFIESYQYKKAEGVPSFFAHLEYPYFDKVLKLPISKIIIHFFYNETVILEWQFEQTAQKPKDTGCSMALMAYWKRLLSGAYIHESGAKNKMLSPAQVIDINEKLRFAYSTFKTTDVGSCFNLSLYKGGQQLGDSLNFGQQIHVMDNDEAQDSCDDFHGFFRALSSHILKPFDLQIAESEEDSADNKNGSITFLGDDRARVISSMVFSGYTPDNITKGDESWKFLDPELDILFSRFRVVDSYSRYYFSDQDFEKMDREGRIYDRYKSNGSLYCVTDHSFVFMGFGDYSLEHIHEKHMKTIYSRMFLVALFYVTILHKFSKDVSKRACKNHGLIDLREELNIFTNGFWFEQVSSQVQGEELFSMMRNNSSMDNDYRLIHNEIERMDELEAAKSTRMNERFEWVVAAVAIIGFGYTLLHVWNNYWPYPAYQIAKIVESWQIYSLLKDHQMPIYIFVLSLILWGVWATLLYSSGFCEKMKQYHIRKRGAYSRGRGIFDWLRSPFVWLAGFGRKKL